MTEVYYTIQNNDDGNCIVTTEKEFWDKNHCLDDGSTQTYHDIYDAMDMAIIYEISESVFAMPDTMDEEDLVDTMAEFGLKFIRNDDLV